MAAAQQKFQVSSNILPQKFQDEVKSLFWATEFPYNNPYKLLKTEVLRNFVPKTGSSMDRALGRVLSGKPSQLARALVTDVCKIELNCDCCPDNVLALWRRQLPSHVRVGITSLPFNKDNFNNVVNHSAALNMPLLWQIRLIWRIKKIRTKMKNHSAALNATSNLQVLLI